MKTLFIAAIVGLALVLAGPCIAQELKTVAECRAHREAWYASASNDTKRLSVSDLVHRADQMIICGRDIDNKPVEVGMTRAQATDALLDASGYDQLALAYYREAFSRASRFIDKKNLSNEFIADDKNRKIVRSPDTSKLSK
ncbi:MAG: hypothetical protein LAO20_21975 [Acidobacteriia bacterium]|nr:hypothetical protein [Terriglobia bacterium]